MGKQVAHPAARSHTAVHGGHPGRGRPWAAPLAGGAGTLVAGGFVTYHSLPIHSAVTNPYFGEDVGALLWVTVVVTVAAGVWAAYEGLVVDRRVSSTA